MLKKEKKKMSESITKTPAQNTAYLNTSMENSGYEEFGQHQPKRQIRKLAFKIKLNFKF